MVINNLKIQNITNDLLNLHKKIPKFSTDIFTRPRSCKIFHFFIIKYQYLFKLFKKNLIIIIRIIKMKVYVRSENNKNIIILNGDLVNHSEIL